MRVVIVGAGIGGIATALALGRAGIDHVVLEQAPALTAVGAGIQLSPNATRVLGLLGLGDALAAVAVRPGSHRFRDWKTGEDVLRTPLGDAAERVFGSSYFHAHRADLLDVLLAGLDRSRLRLDARVVAIGQDADGAWAETADGRRERGDVLIGADGIHSLVRRELAGADRPRFSGYMAWRGLVPAERAAPLGIARDSHVWMGPGRSMVVYWVSAGRLLNWIAICPSDGEAEESWTAEGTTGAALRDYDGWHPEVTGLIAASEPPLKWAIYDRDPLPRWVDGRIALLGDAAHSMLPFHAQGVAQSIEDAWVLARALGEAGAAGATDALRRYEALRLERASHVQEMSRGIEHVVHAAEPEAVERRNRRFREQHAKHPDGFPPGQKWLYGYDAEAAVAGDEGEWRQARW